MARAIAPRAGCIEIYAPPGGGTAYQITAAGYQFIYERARQGCSIDEIADALRVSGFLLRSKLDLGNSLDPEARQAFLEGVSEFRLELRQKQLALAGESAQMAIWLGKQHLGQRDQVEVLIDQTVHVVGATPDYQQEAIDWQRKFAPAGLPLQAATVIDVKPEDAVTKSAGNEPGSDPVEKHDGPVQQNGRDAGVRPPAPANPGGPPGNGLRLQRHQAAQSARRRAAGFYVTAGGNIEFPEGAEQADVGADDGGGRICD